MVKAVSSAKVQCQIITGSEGFSLSDLGRVSVRLCSRIRMFVVHVLARPWQKFSWKLILNSCRASFRELRSLFSKKELLRINRDGIEDIFEGKEEREKETRRYSRIVLNAETRDWIALKPTRRTSSWTSVKRVICFTGVPTRRDVVSRAKTRCQYSAWTAWISSIDCLTLTDTNLCPSDIRATFETKRICSCAPDCLSWFLDFADEDKTFGFNFFENLISKMECKVRSTNFVFSEVFLIWKLIYIVVLIDFYYILCLITNESFEVSFFF